MVALRSPTRAALAAVLIAVPVGLAGLWRHTGSTAQEGESGEPAGGLDYEMGDGATGNPWIDAACHWPSMAPADTEALRASPPEGAREHFLRWAKAAVAEKWLPDDFPEGVPYLAEWGFVSVKQTEEYRVRVREATKPAYTGSPILTKAIVVAVEPLAGPIPVPTSESAMVALQREFLGPKLAGAVEEDQKAPRFRELGTARFLARCPRDVPAQLYGWTDGRILLMAAYEDVSYGTGPTPHPVVKPTPPPSEEKIEVQPGVDPEQPDE